MEYRRWEDYFWPGTDVLRNKLNVRDAIVLSYVETQVSHVRIFEHVLNDEPVDTFDYAYMRRVHRQLFGDIYDWAGQPRVVPETAMTKRGPDVVNHEVGDPDAPTVAYRYYPGPKVAEAADNLYSRLAAEDYLTGLGQRQFVDRLSRYWGAVDQIHSFREGNTRSQFVFFFDLARNAGYSLDLQALYDERRSEFVAARFHGHASGHYGRLTELLTDTVTPRRSLELTGREYRWAASLMEQVERTQRDGGSARQRPGALTRNSPTRRAESAQAHALPSQDVGARPDTEHMSAWWDEQLAGYSPAAPLPAVYTPPAPVPAAGGPQHHAAPQPCRGRPQRVALVVEPGTDHRPTARAGNRPTGHRRLRAGARPGRRSGAFSGHALQPPVRR